MAREAMFVIASYMRWSTHTRPTGTTYTTKRPFRPSASRMAGAISRDMAGCWSSCITRLLLRRPGHINRRPALGVRPGGVGDEEEVRPHQLDGRRDAARCPVVDSLGAVLLQPEQLRNPRGTTHRGDERSVSVSVKLLHRVITRDV